MKYLYLAGSIIFTVLILILGFQNVGATVNMGSFFFTPLNSTPAFLIIFGVALLGIITGACYTGFLSQLFKTDGEDEDEDSNW